MTKDLVTGCCVCRDWRDPKPENPNEHYDPHFYTPTPEQRREHYFSGGTFNHGQCPPCTVLVWKNDEASESEIEDFVREADEQRIYREKNPR
jgi:hypothetical protein